MAKLKSGTRVYGDLSVDSRIDLKNFSAPPSTPVADTLTLFAIDSAGRSMPSFLGPSGLDSPLQPAIARNKSCLWIWPGNTTSTTSISWGIAPPTTAGTATARNVSTTNLFTTMKRAGYVTSTTTGSSAGVRLAAAQFWRGNATGLGGFYFVTRFGYSTRAPVTAVRSFVGLSASTGTPSNTEPSSINNSVGVGMISTSTNLHIITRSSTAATTIDLGTSFPANTFDTDMYELILFAAPNGSSIGYKVTRLNTGDTTSGTLTTNLPVDTTLMGIQQWINNNSSGQAYGIDVVATYIETDY